MIFDGKLKAFFDWLEADYLDKIPDWAFMLMIIVALGILLFKFFRYRCSKCGSIMKNITGEGDAAATYICKRCGYQAMIFG